MTTPYVGEIRLFPYTYAPVNWLDCDGSLQSIANYETLFQLIGTTYGGDGVNTFALPDLRGRVPIHQGQGNGLSPHILGQMSGSESVTLLASQMPAHSHTYHVTSSTASSPTPSNSQQLGAVSGDTIYTTDITGINSADMASAAVSAMGGSQPHDNLMPTLTVRFCIAAFGVFPTQS